MPLKSVPLVRSLVLCIALLVFVPASGHALGNETGKVSGLITTLPAKELDTAFPREAIIPVTPEEAGLDSLVASSVPTILEAPVLPIKLRPVGLPATHPGRPAISQTLTDSTLLVGSLPDVVKQKEPIRPPELLPEPDPSPGVVYIIPFASVMVPDAVYDQVFDAFVNSLLENSERLRLQFVILKEGFDEVSPEWLAARSYVKGEIYAYVEESGCCSTDLRTRARIKYYNARQETPALDYLVPVSAFFEHDNTTLGAERAKLADSIAATLSAEVLDVLQPISTGKFQKISLNKAGEQ